MTAADVPEVVRELAGRLADAFETDRGLAEQQNDYQDRLRSANGQLWSGFIPTRSGCSMTTRRLGFMTAPA